MDSMQTAMKKQDVVDTETSADEFTKNTSAGMVSAGEGARIPAPDGEMAFLPSKNKGELNMSQSQISRSNLIRSNGLLGSIKRLLVRFAEWSGWLMDIDEDAVQRYLHSRP